MRHGYERALWASGVVSLFAPEVAVLDTHCDARIGADQFRQFAGDRDRAVFTACAAYGNCGVAFVLALVAGQYRGEGFGVILDKVFGALLGENVVTDLGVETGFV